MQLDRRAARADNSALSLAAVQSSCTAIAHNHQISLPTIEVVWGHQSQPVQLDLHAFSPHGNQRTAKVTRTVQLRLRVRMCTWSCPASYQRHGPVDRQSCVFPPGELVTVGVTPAR
jgi:hypothetical protein